MTKIVELFGAEDVFMISQAKAKTREKCAMWLHKTMRIGERTGFAAGEHQDSPRHHRPSRAAELGIAHLVDDEDLACLSIYSKQKVTPAKQ